ncbi:programmed cell death protein [Rhizoclosmatium sp. JEL0117]|nr:programmed cell death protein [Rhizoclosmatium sp. JEL0117]
MAVQLAYASLDWPVIGGTDTDSDPYLDKIGGSAVWLSNQPYPHGHPKCKQCASEMFLLSQVMASTLPSGTPNASLDRVLYVFACNKALCSKRDGSFLVLRAIRAPAVKNQQASQKSAAPSATVETQQKPVVLTPTNSKQPQRPQKFRIKSDFASLQVEESTAVSQPVKSTATKKKTSIFAAPAFGEDSGGFGNAFGSGSNAFGAASGGDDEISKLLNQRDKGYAAWVDDEQEEETVEAQEAASKKKSKSKKGKQQAKLDEGEDDVDPVSEIQDGLSKMEIGSIGPHFPGYALEFFDPSEASSKKDKDDSHALELLAQYQKAESIDLTALLERAAAMESGSSSGGREDKNDGTAGWEGEVYEKTQIKGVTKTFKTFQKTVAKFPEQCIRYGFKAEPLVYNDRPYAPPSPCPHCHAPRVFEMQLMPALLSFLPVEEYALKEANTPKPSKNAKPSLADLSAKGVDFGTALVFTCSKNCLGSSVDGSVIRYLEETVVIQHDDW